MINITELMRGIDCGKCDDVIFEVIENHVMIYDNESGEVLYVDRIH